MSYAPIIEKMICFYKGNAHDIAHFLKVYTYARMIAELEGVDAKTQKIVEITSIVHDIACPLCRSKYGNADGKHQEEESGALLDEFLKEFNLPEDEYLRIRYIVCHHHTYTNVDGIDYRIMLEADFLVNADESHASKEAILNMKKTAYRTEAGTRLLDEIYLNN